MKQLAPHVWQLGGFPPHAINLYLIGDVLIDCGTKRSAQRIRRQVRGRTISQIALTHVHPDHQGTAWLFREEWQVPLACHAGDVDSMEGRAPVQRKNTDALYNRIIAKLWTGPPAPVDRVLQEGDEVAGFRVVHAPGHTPGSVVFFRDSDRVAIVGDVLLTMNLFTGWPGLHEPLPQFTFDPAENRRSICKLAALQPSLICPGHGPPWRNLDAFAGFVERCRIE